MSSTSSTQPLRLRPTLKRQISLVIRLQDTQVSAPRRTPPPQESGQEHQDSSDTTSFSTEKPGVLLQNADKNETPPNTGFDDSKAYNLFLAVQATPQEVLAAQIVGGKEGDKDARERLNPRPISAPSQATPHSSPLGISAAQAATAS